jgi:hypothetical protein
VEHQLLGGKSDESARTLITRRGRTENHGRERGKGARVGRCRPRNEILYILALGCGKYREEKRRGRLATVAGCGDNAQRALADPPPASLVAEGRAPTPTPNDLSGGTSAVCNRSRANDEENSRAVFECIVHRDQAVGIDDDFFRELLRIERRVQRSTFFFTPRPGDAAIKNPRKHGAWLRNLGEGARHQVCDDVRGTRSLSRRNRRLRSVYSRQNFTFGGSNKDAGLRSAAIHSDYDLTHSSGLHRSAPGV